MKPTGRNLRFKTAHRLTVTLDKRLYEFVHSRARSTNLTPSQIVYSALFHVVSVKHDEWLAYPKKIAKELRKEGLTLIQIAHELNRRGFRTRKGNRFRPDTVWRLVPKRRKK